MTIKKLVQFIALTSSLALATPGARAANTDLRIGIQTFSLRHLSFEEALEVIHGLGVKYIETYEGHLPTNAPPQRLKQVKRRLKELDLKLLAYGVIGLDKGAPERTRSLFSFAKAMELYSISANPELTPEVWNPLERFAEKSGIKIAIHPHGPEYDRYPGWKKIQKETADKYPGIGICMDVGHVTRNGEDPVEGILALGNRVYGVHLKDANRDNSVAIMGEGIIDIRGVIQALKKVNYQGIVSLEYEPPDGIDPIPGIRRSLSYVNSILEKL